MRWSVGFLILIGVCFPSANLQDVENFTGIYKYQAGNIIYLIGNDEQLTITVPLGGGDELTFKPFRLIDIPLSVRRVILIDKGDDIYDVNAVFIELLVEAFCTPSDGSYCRATIKSFNYTATFKGEIETDLPTFIDGKIENPDAIEVASITLSDVPADEIEAAQTGVAQQLKEAVASGGPLGPLLFAIEDALNSSFLRVIFRSFL